jgi:hypothetical protein
MTLVEELSAGVSDVFEEASALNVGRTAVGEGIKAASFGELPAMTVVVRVIVVYVVVVLVPHVSSGAIDVNG